MSFIARSALVFGVFATAAGCARVSAIDRFGGSVTTVHVARMAPGENIETVRDALATAIYAYGDVARVTVVSPDTLRIEAQYGTSAALRLNELIEHQNRRKTSIEVRGAHTTNTATNLTRHESGVFFERTALVDGSQLVSATVTNRGFEVRFDSAGDTALRNLQRRNPAALLAIFLEGEFAAALPIADLVSDGVLVFRANGAPWQSSLAAVASASFPATLRIDDVEEHPAPEYEGKGSKYPW